MTSAFTFLTPRESDKPYTVSEINAGLALIIESGNTLVWVEGEISNFRKASSGHCYLKLKDADSQVPAVLWRSAAAKLDFAPEDGMAVMAIATIRCYQKGGYYQLDIQRMQPAGIGALFAAFEKLKKKLAEEGLFDEAHKKPLPATVTSLGVITAKGGAAVRDIIKVVAKRSPQTSIVLYDVLVQGEKAPAMIARAIEDMNIYGKVDCLIVGRGGGSVEDLWAFNDERVARAIFGSRIPIVSAVGHEIDFTIADFVADMRAPTPSAAAEMVVPDRQQNRRYFDALLQRFSTTVVRYLAQAWETYRSLGARHVLRRPVRMIAETRQECDELHERQVRAMAHVLGHGRMRMQQASAHLHALSPLAVLSRGYSVVQKHSGETVRQTSQLKPGENVTLRLHEGRATAEVREIAG